MKLISTNLDGKEFSLSDRSIPESAQNIFTVIIGKNGTGKSRLLSGIVDTMLNVQRYNQNHVQLKKSRKKELEFANNGQIIPVYSGKGRAKNRIYQRNRLSKENLCKRLIAATTSPFDKFPQESEYKERKKNDDHFYEYIGLRNSVGSLSDNSFVQRFALSLLIDNQRPAIERILKYLGFGSNIQLKFTHNKERYFDKNALTDSNASFSSLLTRNTNLYKYVIEDNNAELSRYILEAHLMERSGGEVLSQSIKKKAKDSFSRTNLRHLYMKKYYEKSLNELIGSDELPSTYSTVNSKLTAQEKENLIRAIRLNISRVESVILTNSEGKQFKFDDASSGERALLLLVCSIANSIKNDSVILIDEPEISLHPEWQENFLDLLNQAFKHFINCHFVIATHSPLLVSNIPNDNCFILNLDKDVLQSGRDYINKSSDYQLARLFNTPGNQNEYLNRLCVNILSSISQTGSLRQGQENDIKFLLSIKETLDKSDTVHDLIKLIETAYKVIRA
ncbi:AAA family ATPase [Vibrio harveyi]|uniref:AAA family ATPase n=1 Tax=Vibrio harveyi TaxID=669 RepID=UPI00288E67ED|nr:AAA family ATPase [Vibrio harveyi]